MDERTRELIRSAKILLETEGEEQGKLNFKRIKMGPKDLLKEPQAICGLKKMAIRKEIENEDCKIIECSYPNQIHKLKEDEMYEIYTEGENVGFATVITIDYLKCRLNLGVLNKIVSELEALSTFDLIAIEEFPRTVIEHLGRIEENRGGVSNNTALVKTLVNRSPQKAINDFCQPTTIDEFVAVFQKFDNQFAIIQGPPGAGKTTFGAQLIYRLRKSGFKVGFTSNSHAAINNLAYAIDKINDRESSKIKIRKGESFPISKHKAIQENENIKAFPSKNITRIMREEDGVICGTAYMWCNKGNNDLLDFLFVDEASQVTAPFGFALGSKTKNIIFLGDQNQLGSIFLTETDSAFKTSILEYLVQGRSITPPELGFFMDKTYRMTEPLCRFISHCFYEGQLKTASIYSGLGVWRLEAQHQGNTVASKEEAELIYKVLEKLPPHSSKIIVAPFNAQVFLIKSVLKSVGMTDIEVGTVDYFQGREADFVLVSLAHSGDVLSDKEIEFLFDRRRLNVAISRARAGSVLICTNRLFSFLNEGIPYQKEIKDQCSILRTLDELESISVSKAS